MKASILTVAAASLLFFDAALGAGLYPKNSDVLNVDAKNYQRLIAKANHTSIVEFYAPWCGHCQSLKPAYEKAAKNLKGLAKVAAVNCDDEDNKPFCGSMGVQGFPTLKIVRPGKKPGKPSVEDYKGPRATKDIVDAVVDRIPNHVKKLQDKDLDSFVDGGKPKAILFTEKGTTSALLKALAIDFLDVIDVAQVRNKESKTVERFEIDSFPTLVLIPAGDTEAIKYDGEMAKEPMVAFLSQAASPNPDAATSGKTPPADKKKASSFSKASSAHQASEATSAAASAAASESIEPDTPLASPDPNLHAPDSGAAKPAPVPAVPSPVPTLATADALRAACLTSDSPICFLISLPLVPSSKENDPELADEHADMQAPLHDEEAALPAPAAQALDSVADIAHRNRHIKLYAIPASNAVSWSMRETLGLRDREDPLPELLATNAKKLWWKRYSGEGLGVREIEGWIDDVRMGEGEKLPLPSELVSERPTGGMPMQGGHDEPIELNLEDLGNLPDGLEIELEEIPMDEHDEL